MGNVQDLLKVLAERGWTDTKIRNKGKVERSTLMRIRKGIHRNPRPETIARLIRLLNQPVPR